MVGSFHRIALAGVLGGAVLAPWTLAVPARAATHSALTVSPAKVRIGGRAVVAGRHLRSNLYATIIFQAPKGSQGRTGAVLGVAHVNSRGHLSLKVNIPVVTRCGRATLYAIAAQHGVLATGSVILTGCKASSGPSSPPPPPSPKKRKP